MPLTRIVSRGITDGTITSADLASGVGGKVLQVITANDETQRNTTSTSFVTASNTLSVSITPSSTNNKIFILVTGTLYNSTGQVYSVATVYRDATDLGASSGRGLTLMYTPSGSDATSSMAMSVLDSPNTTSAITYQVYFKRVVGGSAVLNQGTSESTITAFEIAG